VANVHFNVTANPYAEWAAQQIINAFPYEGAPRFLLRDCDAIYGKYFKKRVKDMGIEEVLIAPQSPWQKLRARRLLVPLPQLFSAFVFSSSTHVGLPPSPQTSFWEGQRWHLPIVQLRTAA
jgi:hypothetical protein